MLRRALFLLFFILLCLSAIAQKTGTPDNPVVPPAPAGDGGARLPVKRVVLYKNGVGYFEHSARVRETQELNIDFTTAQLNDVLKSLTVVDLGEGRISSVRYNSIAPLDERLKALRLPFAERITRADYLAALRGARVEVRSGGAAVTGRLLSVETEQRTNEKTSYVVTLFSVVTDSGEMRNFELEPGVSVRIAEHDLSDEVGRYMNLVGSSRARDLRRMTISDTGTGDRNVFVSYISEVPVWKSTYRIILPGKPNEKPLLQGWAIVDNTVGEDWKDVQLSLIAGSPQSFIQNISQPYYTRRPVVELPASAMLTPQAHEGTMTEESSAEPSETDKVTDGKKSTELAIHGAVGGLLQPMFGLGGGGGSLAGTVVDPSGAAVDGSIATLRNVQTGTTQQATTDSRGVYQFYNLPVGNYNLSISHVGFRNFSTRNVQVLSGRANVVNATLNVASTAETIEVDGGQVNLSEVAGKQHVEAEGKDLGDYFEYNVKQPISIGKNQSALVPILQAHVEAERVSIWNEESKEIRRALWLNNSSGLTLDSGTFNILDGDTFAGEGLIETLHPAERRLISYAADPALRITMDEEGSEKPATHVRIAKGVMVLTREQRDSRAYTLHNSDTQPRQVVIEHPLREGWKLAEGVKAEETSPSFMRFRVSVGPGKTENLKIEEFHPEETEYELNDLEDDQIKLISEQPLTPAVRDLFRRVLDQKTQISGLEAQVGTRQRDIDAITKDQARVRENMKALKGTAEERALVQRYTKQLDSQEDRMSLLTKEISDLQDKKSNAEEQFEQMLQGVVMDEKL
jgi:hypothetical protein